MKVYIVLALAIVLCTVVVSQHFSSMKEPKGSMKKPKAAQLDAEPVVKSQLFLEEGCPECFVVKEELVPILLDKLGSDGLQFQNVCDSAVRRQIYELERKLGFSAKALAPILILGGKAYCGVESIRQAVEGL